MFQEHLAGIMRVAAGDAQVLALIAGLKRAIRAYHGSVVAATVAADVQLHRLPPEEYEKLAMRIEKRRQRTHDELVAAVASTNEYLFATYPGRVPKWGVFCGTPISDEYGPDRYDIREWARVAAPMI